MNKDENKGNKKSEPIKIAQQEYYASKTFLQSYWSVFIVIPIFGLGTFGEYFKFVKPYLETFKDEATQGNLAVFSVLVYFAFIIGVPVLAIYGISKFLKKKNVT